MHCGHHITEADPKVNKGDDSNMCINNDHSDEQRIILMMTLSTMQTHDLELPTNDQVLHKFNDETPKLMGL